MADFNQRYCHLENARSRIEDICTDNARMGAFNVPVLFVVFRGF